MAIKHLFVNTDILIS